MRHRLAFDQHSTIEFALHCDPISPIQYTIHQVYYLMKETECHLLFTTLSKVSVPSRQFFLRHVEGMRDDQWDWKPFDECKSIRETIVHLLGNDRSIATSIEMGAGSFYAKYV